MAERGLSILLTGLVLYRLMAHGDKGVEAPAGVASFVLTDHSRYKIYLDVEMNLATHRLAIFTHPEGFFVQFLPLLHL